MNEACMLSTLNPLSMCELHSSQLLEEEGDVAPFSYEQEKIQSVCVCVLVSFLHNCLLLITSLIKLITQNHHTTQALRAIKHISIVSTHKEHGNKREMKRKTSIDS